MASTVRSCVEVGELYLEVHHRIHRFVDEAMNDAGLSLSRAKVLRVLAEQGPMKQGRGGLRARLRTTLGHRHSRRARA